MVDSRLAGDRLLKSWHQQIEGLRLRLGGSSKTGDVIRCVGINQMGSMCKARQVREARSGQRAAEGTDLG